jgi:hypothetical protein
MPLQDGFADIRRPIVIAVDEYQPARFEIAVGATVRPGGVGRAQHDGGPAGNGFAARGVQAAHEIVDGGAHAAVAQHVVERRNAEPQREGQDTDDDHEFDEAEAFLFFVHRNARPESLYSGGMLPPSAAQGKRCR